MPISVKQPKRSSHQFCEPREKSLDKLESVDPLKENFPQLGRGDQAAKNRVLGAWAVNLTSKLPGSAAQDHAASVSDQETLPKEPKRRWSDITSCETTPPIIGSDAHSREDVDRTLGSQSPKQKQAKDSISLDAPKGGQKKKTWSDITSCHTSAKDTSCEDTTEPQESTKHIAPCNDTESQNKDSGEAVTLDVPVSAAQRKTAKVLEVLLMECIRLMANFSHNYTTGLTRMEATSMPEKERNQSAALLKRCEPMIYGGAAYSILHRAVANASRSEAATSPAPFRQTTDIDVRCPFPASHKRRGWQHFTHQTAMRAFEVAQDRVLEMVELLNMASDKHISSLRANGITLHKQEATPSGLIDCSTLHSLARKRPSSRFDHVFPTFGGMGPFFASFVYNEHAVFYTFKVCYVWSAPEISFGEPQYAELIELQMVPEVASGNSCKSPTPGFELRIGESLNQAEWPSLDSSEPEVTRSESRFCLSWNADVKAGDMRGRVCIEDPRELAEDSARAVTNRLARGCRKDGDWEKVLTDEHRVRWLQSVSESNALETHFGTPSEVLEVTCGKCQSALAVRK